MVTKKCLEILSSGVVIIYPTDTVYGIGCDDLKCSVSCFSCASKWFVDIYEYFPGMISFIFTGDEDRVNVLVQVLNEGDDGKVGSGKKRDPIKDPA